MTALDELRQLYYRTTAKTIERDLARAIALLRQMPEAERERAAVFMDGLSQMRSEWSAARPRPPVVPAGRNAGRRPRD